jgi:pimeloyl-ACP methyl ester carboxylesterase
MGLFADAGGSAEAYGRRMGTDASARLAGTSTVEVDGTALAYRQTGSGEPVVLVHGTASDLRMWDRQRAAFGVDRRAIAYSRRYAWPNEDIAPGLDDEMPPHAADLLGLLHALDAAPAHVVGHSWGGFVALLAAIREPEAIRSLVLCEPPVLSLFASTPPRPAELLRLAVHRPRTAAAIIRFGAGTIAPAQRAFRRGDDAAGLARFGRGVLGREAFARLTDERWQAARANAGAARAQILGAGFPPLADDDVRSVRVPVLLVTGERSPAFLLRLTDRLEELLPNAERVVIKGASHAMNEDRPDAFNAAVLPFLAGVASTAG